MIEDLRLHGSLNEKVEYFALIGGDHPSHVLSYEDGPGSIRFFYQGNEFILGRQGINYWATGGSFCRYMFGMDQPREDLMLPDVRNRLVMFGAVEDQGGNLLFTDHVEGAETHESVFHNGNALENYYFFVAHREQRFQARERQAKTLRSLGKFLKRADLFQGQHDTEIMRGILGALDEPGAVVFLFRLRNRATSDYADALVRSLDDEAETTPDDEARLKALAEEGGLDFFQRERIRVDSMYRFAQNKRVVDEYRTILVRAPGETFSERDQARLTRLRTLALRKHIPMVLLDTLDDQILGGQVIAKPAGKSGLDEARSILEGLFLEDPSLHGHIVAEDIVRLLRTKHQMRTRYDLAFDRLMLDTGKALDDHLRETNDFGPLERFSEIVTFFDRYDNLSGAINRLAFMGGTTLNQDSLRSIIGSKEAFAGLSPDLFEELFTTPLVSDPYTPRYGRLKVKALVEGLWRIVAGERTYEQVVQAVGSVAREEHLHGAVLGILRKRLRGVFPELETTDGRQRFRDDIVRELRESGEMGQEEDFPEDVFDRALLDLKKEFLYIGHLLPDIIRRRNLELREDFLRNSGLDRFHVEALERDFIESEGLDEELVRVLQEGAGEAAPAAPF